MPAFWACKEVTDMDKVNAKRDWKEVTVKIGASSHTIAVPIIVNTKLLQSGDEIFVQMINA